MIRENINYMLDQDRIFLGIILVLGLLTLYSIMKIIRFTRKQQVLKWQFEEQLRQEILKCGYKVDK